MQKNYNFIMLNEDLGQEKQEFDPFLNIFEEGMEEFVKYQRQKGENYKTKAERHKEKLQRLERDLNDQQLRKQRNHERRQADKAKLLKIKETMSQEEVKKFMKERKEKKKEEREKVLKAMNTGQVMMIDLVFQEKMNGKENKSLTKQIQLIMKGIKHIDQPPSIHLCSYGSLAKIQLQKMGIQYWPLTVHEENIVQVGKKIGKKLVYLSPDAELPLEKVEPDTAYILGGLIDRSIIKYASLMRARELGIEARRLPIRQFMKSRIVLNLDHVVMMVCKYRDVNDWKEAFDYAAPKRWKKDSEKEEKQEQEEEIGEQKQQHKAQSDPQQFEQKQIDVSDI